MIVTSQSRPASVARTKVVNGGRTGVANYVDHPSVEGKKVFVGVTEIAPERLAVLSAILDRPERLEFGSDKNKPDVGREADWLTEHLGQGTHRVGAYDAVVTVGKGLSMLAATNPVVRDAMHDALRAGASAYYDYVAHNAMTRIGPEGGQRHVPINPNSLRAVGWIHGHSAAGDPHAHVHLLIGTTIQVGDDPRPRAIHTKHFLDEVAQAAEAAARVAMIRAFRAHGIVVDPLSLDLAGIDDKTLKSLDRFSKMREVVKEAEAHGLSHQAAWRAARRAIGKDNRQPLADDLNPLLEQVQAWAETTWTIPTAEGDVQLRLSNVEALEHALDALSRTPEGQKVVIQWQQDRSGGAFLRAIDELERIRLQAQNQRQELTLDEARQVAKHYLIRLGQAAEKGQVITRSALSSHAAAIAAAHPELPFEQVNTFLQRNFTDHPTRKRGLIAVAELNADIELAEKAMQHLTPAKNVRHALTHHVGLSVIQGVAGAGKTTAVAEAARKRWARENGQIWVLARNAKTADDLGLAVRRALRKVGDDPDRVHKMPLAHPAWWNNIKPGDRVIVDEFALAERRDLAKLITVAKRCPVTLLGDTHQQRAIESPTAAQVIAHIAQATGQPNLEETMRCKAWRTLHDDLRAAPTEEQARDRTVANLDVRVVRSAAEAARIAEAEGATLFALTNERVAEAAAAVQRSSGPTIQVQYGVKVSRGDKVVFHAIVRNNKMHILGKTGEIATIVAITKTHVTLRHEDERLEDVPLDAAREHLGPATAQTIDSAQGRTVEKAAVLIEGTEDAHSLYTGATRGREAPIVLVLQGAEQNEDTRAAGFEQHADPREVVRQVLERSDRGTFLGLANEDRHALLDELRERGHNRVAERLENLEANIESWQRAQEQVRQREPEQKQRQELDDDERIRREVERQWEEMERRLRIPPMPGYDMGPPGSRGWGLRL
jgi:hypothetical protein